MEGHIWTKPVKKLSVPERMAMEIAGYSIWFVMAIASILGAIIRGVVFSFLWGWFVAEPFRLASVSMIQGVGIILIFNCLVHRIPSLSSEVVNISALSKVEEQQDPLVMKDWICTMFARSEVATLANPLLVFTVGWVLHLFL